MSKAKKKNQKRAAKKHQGDGGFVVDETIVSAGPQIVRKPDPAAELREQLAQAKADKDHELTNKLRQQLWIAQDLAAGYKPQLSSEDTDGREALSKAVETIAVSSSSSSSTARAKPAAPSSDRSSDERRLKTLTKKLEQIQKLKRKQEEGLKLESNQLAKIQSEQELLEEIAHVEQLLSVPARR